MARATQPPVTQPPVTQPPVTRAVTDEGRLVGLRD